MSSFASSDWPQAETKSSGTASTTARNAFRINQPLRCKKLSLVQQAQRRALLREACSPNNGVQCHGPRSKPQNHTKRSEEHTSELQSLMRISYAVFCLKKTNNKLLQPTH